ncbi:MAG: heavy metal translocating P-type ATPase, partial [Promethearchaeota archaeon]
MKEKKGDGEEMGKQEHRKKMMHDFKIRFYVSLVLTVPILIFSPTIQSIFGISFQFPGIRIISFIMSSIIFFYGGYPFLNGLYQELKDKQPGM